MLLRALGLLACFFLLANPTLAETPSLSPNPLTASGEPITEIKGYLGTGAEGTVRVFRDLSLKKYFDIPRSAIVHSTQTASDTTAAVSVYVKSNAVITSGTIGTAEALASMMPPRNPTARSPEDCILYCAECPWNPSMCVACYFCGTGTLPEH